MADNIQIKDATGTTKTVRSTDTSGSDLHVPIHRLDSVNVTGPTAQSVLNIDLLGGVSNGWYDASAFFSGTVQIVAGAGISAGAVFFEQTNDNTSTIGIPLPAQEVSVVNANPIVAAVAIAASTRRAWQVSLTMKYIRVRISTAFVGGTVQAVAAFAQQPYAFPAVNVQQATAANLQATVAQATAANLNATVVQATAANLNATVTQLTPTTSFTNSAATTNATSVKASAGTVFGVTASNINAAARFLKLYNLAVAPTVGTSVPVLTIPIPAGSVVTVPLGTLGARFTTGIAFAITAAAADTDTTVVAASEIKVAINYV